MLIDKKIILAVFYLNFITNPNPFQNANSYVLFFKII